MALRFYGDFVAIFLHPIYRHRHEEDMKSCSNFEVKYVLIHCLAKEKETIEPQTCYFLFQ